MSLSDLKPGDAAYRVGGNGVVRHFCPVVVDRLTKTQIIVVTPKNRRERFYLKNGRSVGGLSSTYVTTEKPVEGRAMILSAEAKPVERGEE
jgi:hypothetical protein